MKSEVFLSDKGHLLHERSYEVSDYLGFEKACMPYTFTFATKKLDSHIIRLIRHWYECAACFRTFPASAENAHDATKESSREMDFFDWAFQTVITGFNTPSDTYCFFTLPDKDEAIICPHCGYIACTTTRCLRYEVYTGQDRTVVTQTIEYADRIVAIPSSMIQLCAERSRYPLALELIFGHNSRYTILMLKDCKRKLIRVTNLQNYSNSLKGFIILYHINEDTPLKSIVIDAFSQFYDGAMPFESREITLETLVMLNYFQGFPKVFYQAIPFAKGLRQLENSFKGMGKLLARYSDVPEIYRQIGLPEKKSIRRTIFENPAFLFYAEELAALPFRNPDILLQILCCDDAFLLLSKLRRYRGINTYLTDLVEEVGETRAWKSVKKHIDFIEVAAANYLLCSQEKKQAVLKQGVKDSIEQFYKRENSSIPLLSKSPAVNYDCRIGMYDFCVLKNTNELFIVGKALQNCLVEVHPQDGRIVEIKKQHDFVAALDVKDDTVQQASLVGNIPIEKNTEVYAAFTEWIKVNRLKYSPN